MLPGFALWSLHLFWIVILLSRSIRTIKRGVSKGVVTQRHIIGCLVTLFSLTEHPLSEHFAKEQNPVMIPSHIVIYLLYRQKVGQRESVIQLWKSCFPAESSLVAHRVIVCWVWSIGVVPLWQSDHQYVLHNLTGCCVGIIGRAGGR